MQRPAQLARRQESVYWTDSWHRLICEQILPTPSLLWWQQSLRLRSQLCMATCGASFLCTVETISSPTPLPQPPLDSRGADFQSRPTVVAAGRNEIHLSAAEHVRMEVNRAANCLNCRLLLVHFMSICHSLLQSSRQLHFIQEGCDERKQHSFGVGGLIEREKLVSSFFFPHLFMRLNLSLDLIVGNEFRAATIFALSRLN